LARVETVQDRPESGSVVGDLLEAGKTHERGVVGETPNLAARLQGIAQPNTVIIGESTRAKTRTETLQSEAGYVDARPHQPELTKPIAPHGRTIHWVKNAAEIRSALDLLEAQEQFDPPDLSSRLKRIPGREGREFQISDIGAET
jgi:class 3 adenylate cyclase